MLLVLVLAGFGAVIVRAERPAGQLGRPVAD
jgi:hypothetical protein